MRFSTEFTTKRAYVTYNWVINPKSRLVKLFPDAEIQTQHITYYIFTS